MNEEILKKCESFRNRIFTIDSRTFIFVSWIERYIDGTFDKTAAPDALLLNTSKNPPVIVSMPLDKVIEAIEAQSNQ
jgi:hypothetical protein